MTANAFMYLILCHSPQLRLPVFCVSSSSIFFSFGLFFFSVSSSMCVYHFNSSVSFILSQKPIFILILFIGAHAFLFSVDCSSFCVWLLLFFLSLSVFFRSVFLLSRGATIKLKRMKTIVSHLAWFFVISLSNVWLLFGRFVRSTLCLAQFSNNFQLHDDVDDDDDDDNERQRNVLCL